MKTRHGKTSRRAFFLKGGATLGAVATVAGASSIAAGNPQAIGLKDREAIRRLHLAFIAGVEHQTCAPAVATHQAYRSNALQERDMVSFGADGRHASATWHVDVKVGTPLDGEFTAAQMARLQGMLADVRWESGQLHAQYVRSGDHWQVESVSYEATRT